MRTALLFLSLALSMRGQAPKLELKTTGTVKFNTVEACARAGERSWTRQAICLMNGKKGDWMPVPADLLEAPPMREDLRFYSPLGDRSVFISESQGVTVTGLSDREAILFMGRIVSQSFEYDRDNRQEEAKADAALHKQVSSALGACRDQLKVDQKAFQDLSDSLLNLLPEHPVQKREKDIL